MDFLVQTPRGPLLGIIIIIIIVFFWADDDDTFFFSPRSVSPTNTQHALTPSPAASRLWLEGGGAAVSLSSTNVFDRAQSVGNAAHPKMAQTRGRRILCVYKQGSHDCVVGGNEKGNVCGTRIRGQNVPVSKRLCRRFPDGKTDPRESLENCAGRAQGPILCKYIGKVHVYRSRMVSNPLPINVRLPKMSYTEKISDEFIDFVRVVKIKIGVFVLYY